MKSLKFTTQDLAEKSKKRPQGFQKEILENSVILDSERFEIPFEKFEEIEKKYRLPARLEMFKSLLNGLNSALTDTNRRTPKEIQRCVETCSACDYLIEDEMRCGKCGCFLRIKMQLKTWSCPLKKW